MNKNLILYLIIFSIIWIVVVLKNIRDEKISVRYSLIWFFIAIVLLFVGILTNFMESISSFFGFLTLANLVIGIMITLLMIITFFLTKIVTKQKEQIKNLIQEISLLRNDVKDEK